MNICWHHGYIKTYLMELFIHTHMFIMDMHLAWGAHEGNTVNVNLDSEKLYSASHSFLWTTWELFSPIPLMTRSKSFIPCPSVLMCRSILLFMRPTFTFSLPHFLSLLVGLWQIHSDTNIFTFSTVMSA